MRGCEDLAKTNSRSKLVFGIIMLISCGLGILGFLAYAHYIPPTNSGTIKGLGWIILPFLSTAITEVYFWAVYLVATTVNGVIGVTLLVHRYKCYGR